MLFYEHLQIQDFLVTHLFTEIGTGLPLPWSSHSQALLSSSHVSSFEQGLGLSERTFSSPCSFVFCPAQAH